MSAYAPRAAEKQTFRNRRYGSWLFSNSGRGVKLSVTSLPGSGFSPDSAAEIEAESAWVRDRLGADVPLHFTAFHPDWKLMDRPPTPPQTPRMARRIAMNAGLRYVYIGNIHDPAGQATHCQACGAALIGRDWYDITAWHLSPDGRCAKCGTRCHGVFEAIAGQWGRRRQPVRLRASEPEPMAS
jgi:pyruvate formate lyase activating enzyme